MENSELNSKIKYFKENLNQRIESFKEFRQRMKQRAFVLKMLASLFAVTTTILLGLQGVAGSALLVVKNLALICSAFVTLFTVWDGFFNYRARWIVYSDITSQLNNIKYELEYVTSGNNLDEKRIDELHTKFLSVLNESTEQMLRIKSESSQNKFLKINK
ncbi:MAG: SLATT domain-containing protein [bacterium]